MWILIVRSGREEYQNMDREPINKYVFMFEHVSVDILPKPRNNPYMCVGLNICLVICSLYVYSYCLFGVSSSLTGSEAEMMIHRCIDCLLGGKKCMYHGCKCEIAIYCLWVRVYIQEKPFRARQVGVLAFTTRKVPFIKRVEAFLCTFMYMDSSRIFIVSLVCPIL